jgi:hypothetical protein
MRITWFFIPSVAGLQLARLKTATRGAAKIMAPVGNPRFVAYLAKSTPVLRIRVRMQPLGMQLAGDITNTGATFT